jgi:OmpA-OmpF porin, OOP family
LTEPSVDTTGTSTEQNQQGIRIMKTINKALMAAFVAATLAPVAGLADTYTHHQGYLVDSRQNLVMSGTPGVCWHTTAWTPALAVEGCDPTNKPLAAAPPAALPVVVAAAPIPPPVPQAVRPMPVSQKFAFSGDALFAFDQSVLRPEGKLMLDELVRKLDGATYDTVHATGHTDRFGSLSYNQKLSERRAIAVKEYLVSRNVPAGRIDAEGMGQTQPVTKADECRGAKSASVIDCLQPDRRVDVQTTGAKLVAGSM